MPDRPALPCGACTLSVRFDNGVEKKYDCAPLLERDEFRMLADPGFFNIVRRDPGGYGVSWDDDIDLSEYELWHNGKTEHSAITTPPLFALPG